MRYALILAGGSGTRLWPVSRQDTPKQFAPLLTGDDGHPRTLLEESWARLDGVVRSENRLICSAASDRDRILKLLPGALPTQIIGEPVARDTLAAVALTAAILERRSPGCTIAVLTADHLIAPTAAVRAALDAAYRLAEQHDRRLVTFSVPATAPNSAYGYIVRSTQLPATDHADPPCYTVERFIEKPPTEDARRLIDQGRAAWNSGMFVWRAAALLAAAERFAPAHHQTAQRLAAAWDTPEREALFAEHYAALPRLSVDHGVMVPAATDDTFELLTVTLNADWLDIGSWPALAQTLPADAQNNRTRGAAVLRGTSDSIIYNTQPGHTVAAVGVRGLVIVHTTDATLVLHADDAQELKDLQADLPEELR